MFHINCKQMLQLIPEQPTHSYLADHYANFSRHFFQKNPYQLCRQVWLVPIATMDLRASAYASRRSCAAQIPKQMEDKKRNVEDELKEMVFSFQLLVVDWLPGNQDH